MTNSEMTVLVTCAGKWVGMMLQIRRALEALGGGRLLVADRSASTPAGQFADASFQVPEITSPDYIDQLLDICRENDVNVVLPLIDVDLDRLADHQPRFTRIGTHLVSPAPDIFAMTFDKVLFANFATRNRLAHPKLVPADEFSDTRFPLFYKKKRGFGSIGIGKAESIEDANYALLTEPTLVFQEYVDEPEEYSVDAYVNLAGECVIRVSRTRDKVVGGESQVSVTTRSEGVDDLASRTIKELSAMGLRGPMNIQLFGGVNPRLIEVNPRLGSASVLANMATRGRLIESILKESRGEIAFGDPLDWQEGLRLQRFAGDVFDCDGRILSVSPGPSV